MQYGPSHSRRLRKQSRRLPVKGKGDDKNRYFRCWNCGFICDAERDALAGPEDVSSISYGIYDQRYSTDFVSVGGTIDMGAGGGAEVHGHIDGVPLLTMAVLGKGHIALKEGMDGTSQAIMQNWYPESMAGCPMCGTTNWRGDY